MQMYSQKENMVLVIYDSVLLYRKCCVLKGIFPPPPFDHCRSVHVTMPAPAGHRHAKMSPPPPTVHFAPVPPPPRLLPRSSCRLLLPLVSRFRQPLLQEQGVSRAEPAPRPLQQGEGRLPGRQVRRHHALRAAALRGEGRVGLQAVVHVGRDRGTRRRRRSSEAVRPECQERRRQGESQDDGSE